MKNHRKTLRLLSVFLFSTTRPIFWIFCKRRSFFSLVLFQIDRFHTFLLLIQWRSAVSVAWRGSRAADNSVELTQKPALFSCSEARDFVLFSALCELNRRAQRSRFHWWFLTLSLSLFLALIFSFWIYPEVSQEKLDEKTRKISLFRKTLLTCFDISLQW